MLKCIALLLGLALALPARAELTLPDELAAEPCITDAQRAGLAFFGVEPDRVDGLKTRAALKALLPVLSVKYRRNDNTVNFERINTNVDTEAAESIEDSTGNVNELELAGTWNLPELIFNAEVLDVTSLALLQEGVIKEVTRLYYQRRRLQLDLFYAPPKEESARMAKELALEETTAVLDALTGGLFAKHKARTTRRTR